MPQFKQFSRTLPQPVQSRALRMTIEIHQPEIEALIHQRLKSGGFQNAEQVLIHALRSSPEPQKLPSQVEGKSLVDVCAMVQRLLTDEEIDTIFHRDTSPDRPVDLS